MNREYHEWFSPHLQRKMELLVFGHSGRAILFFPTRMARFYDYENWRMVEMLHGPLERGEMQIICVDSVDNESFYNQHVHPEVRISRHIQYEQYILQEVIPFMQNKAGDNLEVAGCSMGAYHAVNLAMKFPHLFRKVVGMSGRYDLTKPLPDFRDLFDTYHNENIYFNMPLQYLPNLYNNCVLHSLRQTEIILVIGESDPFLESNQHLKWVLNEKNVHNQLHVWENDAHRPRYWRQMIPLYL